MPGFYNLLDAFFPAQAGQVNSGATTTSIPTVGKKYVPSAWKGGYMYFVNGAAQGQFASIVDNDATTFTVSGLTVAPGPGDVFVLYVDLTTIFSPLSAYGSSTAAPLTVDLDTGPYGGRTVVEIWVKSNGAATFNVYGSRNGVDWRLVDTITLTAAGEAHRGYQNSARYIRVSTNAANDNMIEIWASR